MFTNLSIAGQQSPADVLGVLLLVQAGAGQDEAAGPRPPQLRVQEGDAAQVRGGAAPGEGAQEGEVHELQDAEET